LQVPEGHRRVITDANAQELLPPAERKLSTMHPDFVPLKLLGPSVRLLRQMIVTAECYGVDETRKFLKECHIDPRDIDVLDTLIADKRAELYSQLSMND
jgi:hypothetical protein